VSQATACGLIGQCFKGCQREEPPVTQPRAEAPAGNNKLSPSQLLSSSARLRLSFLLSSLFSHLNSTTSLTSLSSQFCNQTKHLPTLSLFFVDTIINMPLEIPSVLSLSTFASGLLSQLPFGNFNTPSRAYVPYGNAPSCPIDSPLSCHNSTEAPDTCCFIYPGGQLLQTQFWDTSPAIGPDDSWTLHGLWYALTMHPIQDETNKHPIGQIFATAATHNSAPAPQRIETSPT